MVTCFESDGLCHVGLDDRAGHHHAADDFGRMTALLVIWFGKFNPVHRGRMEGTVGFLSHWSMLDVFGLALLVFLVEGDALICTEIQPGLFLLSGAIAVNIISSIVVNHLIFSAPSNTSPIKTLGRRGRKNNGRKNKRLQVWDQ